MLAAFNVLGNALGVPLLALRGRLERPVDLSRQLCGFRHQERPGGRPEMLSKSVITS